MASVLSQTSTHRLPGDRYDVLSPLGSGAQSVVLRVRDIRSGAVHAAKLLKPEHVANPETLARFEDEFRILRTLHHPHLPEVFEYGRTEDGGRFLVMELVDGEPLDRYFRAHPDDIWMVLYELCETLVFVHAHNLLHQDIKPSNILVSRVSASEGARPLIKLIDFGLTYRRGTGAAVRLVGTPGYIAPEVVRGERLLTRAVDYYSLGATLYELLCGKPMFAGTESEVLRAHLEHEPVIENEELEWAELYPHVRALLSKDPQRRLVAFEEFRRIIVGRLTGGIDDLDRSYALARIDSLGMIGKHDAWKALLHWLDVSVAGGASSEAHTFSISGIEGVGKCYLASALRAEASLRGIRTLSPSDIGRLDRDDAAARQPAMMWSQLLEVCEKEPVILVIERPMLLRDEERSFVRLAGTQWELFRSRGRVLPLFFLVAVDSTTEDADTLDYLPADGAVTLALPGLDRGDCEQIVDQFRGAMFDTRDARDLQAYLSRFDDVGHALRGLQRAVLRSELTFLGQRWKVQPGLLTEVAESPGADSFSMDVVASLSPLERRVAALVAAHPDAVPLAWIADFVGVDASSISAVATGPLHRLVSASSDAVAPVSSFIRSALYVGSDPSELRHAHEFLAERVVALARSLATDRTLVYHYERLGRVRDAARVHLRLLHAYWRIRPRQRPYDLIEGVCRSGMELLEAHGSSVTRATRRSLFCFYLKQWVNAFWARNLFTRAKPVIDEWTQRLGETMPASVAPRYVRSVLEREGPEEASSIATALLQRGQGRQVAARLWLEYSLCVHYLGNYEQALSVLAAMKDAQVLCRRDLYRLEIYRAMHMSELGRDREGRDLVATFVSDAEANACIDESLLMRAVIARSLIMEGSAVASLSAVARGLRLAAVTGLSYRANLMYRIASTAYEEIGNASRSQQCQEKAIQLADALGLRDISGISWSRLGTTERKAGRYGNALRDFERAVTLTGDDGPAWSRLQTLVGLYGMLVLVQSDARTPLEKLLAQHLAESKEDNSLGYFYCWRGWDLEHDDKYEAAVDAYKQSTKHFTVAGHRSNVAWAMSREARIYLECGRVDEVAKIVESIAADAMLLESGEAAFELSVLKLKQCFISRAHHDLLMHAIIECENALSPAQTASLRIEALQALFRAYARLGMTTEAEDALGRYRELVFEISSNLGRSESPKAIELSGVGDVVDEFARLGRRS